MNWGWHGGRKGLSITTDKMASQFKYSTDELRKRVITAEK